MVYPKPGQEKRVFGRKRRPFMGQALLLLLLMLSGAAFGGMPVRAEVVNSQATILTPEGWEDYAAEAAERRRQAADTDAIPGWPEAPGVGAEGAVVLEVSTGTVLYAKNMDEPLYPASTTKLMTCLLAQEMLDLDDTVTFSDTAIYSVPYDGSKVGMDAGETITVEEALYCILVGSANEVANGVAEKAAGSLEAFADLMNQRAAELGCTHTHFVNAHGYHDENHYTSAFDLALIAAEYFSDDARARFANTPQYHMQATDTQPDDFTIRNKHKLINGELPYTGILGGKTGYTSLARETLVTCAEKNGMRLVCVVMKEEPGEQFTDTAALLDYGFNSFAIRNISAFENRFAVTAPEFLKSGRDILGYSSNFSYLDPDSVVIMPASADFDDLRIEMTRDGDTAELSYYFSDIPVGSAELTFEKPQTGAAGSFGVTAGYTVSGGFTVPEEGSAAAGTDGSGREEEPAAVSGRAAEIWRRFSVDTAAGRFAARIMDRIVTVSDRGTLYIDTKVIVYLLAAVSAAVLAVIFVIHGAFYILEEISERRRW